MAEKKEKTPFSSISYESKRKMLDLWKTTNEQDREHFGNQVVLFLESFGNNDHAKDMVAKIMEFLIKDNSTNLADFGLYVKEKSRAAIPGKDYENFKEAWEKIENYRKRHNLPEKPRKKII